LPRAISGHENYNTLIQKALEIDENYGFTYVPLGRYKMMEYDWQGAERSDKHAVELNPGQSGCHTGYSMYLGSVGRGDESILEAKRAVELDPLSSLPRAMLGWLLILTGQFEQAIEILQETIELDANHPFALVFLAWAYAEKGMYDKAISILQGLSNIPSFAATLGYLYGKVGNQEEAKKVLNDFLDRSKKEYFSPFLIAQVYCGLGEKDKVFDWLNRAYEERDIEQTFIKTYPSFIDLHSDLRWTEQMKKRGLAD
jgi:tetratricopeptide (TPR) repeat protein